MDKDQFSQQILKTDPCLIKYSPDVLLKKTKYLDIFNVDKKYLIKINIESSPWEIWIKIRFLEIIKGSSSLRSTLIHFKCYNNHGDHKLHRISITETRYFLMYNQMRYNAQMILMVNNNKKVLIDQTIKHSDTLIIINLMYIKMLNYRSFCIILWFCKIKRRNIYPSFKKVRKDK